MTEAEMLQKLAEARAEIWDHIFALCGVLAISWIGRFFCYRLMRGERGVSSRGSRSVSSTSSGFSQSSRSSSSDGSPVSWTSDSFGSSCDSSSSDGGSCGGGE